QVVDSPATASVLYPPTEEGEPQESCRVLSTTDDILVQFSVSQYAHSIFLYFDGAALMNRAKEAQTKAMPEGASANSGAGIEARFLPVVSLLVNGFPVLTLSPAYAPSLLRPSYEAPAVRRAPLDDEGLVDLLVFAATHPVVFGEP